MSLKLKILGLGLLAVMATSAFTVMNASAKATGHFFNDAAGGHAEIKGSEVFHSPSHSLKFQATTSAGEPSGEPIICTTADYVGTVSEATTQSLTVTPTYHGCQTTGAAHDTVKVTMNDCNYVFSSNANATIDATVTVKCPVGKAIEIHHPSCTMTVAHQTLGGAAGNGVAYTTTMKNTKHALTVDVTVKNIQAQYHGGICIFLGTSNHIFDMTGGVEIEGLNTNKEAVNITAT